MIQTQYTSFKEIDRDLKILQLQRQIEEEKVKLAFAMHDMDDDGYISAHDIVNYLTTVTREQEFGQEE